MADSQVLICPQCQSAGEWLTDLDRCAVCASIRLVRRLGEVECRECGNVGEPAVAASRAMSQVAGNGPGAPGLAEEVERALARVLRRHSRPHADQLR
jgi:hypothetical protein